MPINAKQYKRFFYVWYRRSTFADTQAFVKALKSAEIFDNGSLCDVVIDVASCAGLSSTEIAAVVRLVQDFKGGPRSVRLLTNESLHKSLMSTNMNTLENLIIYSDQKSFLDQMKEIKTAADAKAVA